MKFKMLMMIAVTLFAVMYCNMAQAQYRICTPQGCFPVAAFRQVVKTTACEEATVVTPTACDAIQDACAPAESCTSCYQATRSLFRLPQFARPWRIFARLRR